MQPQHLTRPSRWTLSRALPAMVVAAALMPAPARAEAPHVSLTSPADGSISNNRTPTFGGLAEEVGGVVTVTIHKGPSLAGPPLALEPSVLVFSPLGAWSVETPEPLEDGTYTAQARETNAAAETGTSGAVTFTIETGAPSVMLLAPPTPSTDATPSFTGTASDPFKPVTVQIHAGEGVAGTVVAIASAIGTGAAWVSGPAAPALATGRYTAVATQESSIPGNPTGRSEPVSFTVVAPAPPSAPLTAQPPGPPAAAFRWVPAAPKTGEEVLLVSSSSDPASALVSFAWSLAGEGSFLAGPSVLATSFATPGPHVVRLRVGAADGTSATASETIPVTGRPAALIAPFPVVRLAGARVTGGVRLALLKVQQLPAGATVTVRCRGRSCPVAAQHRVSVRGRHGIVAPLVFSSFERFLAAGTVLEIKIAKRGEIGKFTRFSVRAGRLPERLDECLDVSGSKPLACPT